MRILKDIISKADIEIVKTIIATRYPGQKNSLSGYDGVYRSLLTMTPVPQELCLRIDHVDEGVNSYEHVHAVARDGIETVSYTFRPWSEWLGLPVSDDTVADYQEAEIVAHCLYEMTYFGFDEDTVKKKAASMVDGDIDGDNLLGEDGEDKKIQKERL